MGPDLLFGCSRSNWCRRVGCGAVLEPSPLVGQARLLGLAHVHGAIRLLAMVALRRAGALGWRGGRRCGQRNIAAGRAGGDQSNAEQVLGSHLQSIRVAPGGGADGCTADRSARRRQAWQRALKPPFATVSTGRQYESGGHSRRTGPTIPCRCSRGPAEAGDEELAPPLPFADALWPAYAALGVSVTSVLGTTFGTITDPALAASGGCVHGHDTEHWQAQAFCPCRCASSADPR